jgi:hypothetical protein
MSEIIIGFGALLISAMSLFLGQWLGRASGRREGRQEAEDAAMRDTTKRVERGREAVSAGRSDDPVDRLRSNEGSWQ